MANSNKGAAVPASEADLFQIKPIPALIAVAVGVIIWFLPPPQSLVDYVSANPDTAYHAANAWHLLAIFVATIIAIILKPLPMGAIAMTSIAVVTISGALGTGKTAMAASISAFANTTIWLIVIAFFISRGFIKTGFGTRIAYWFMRILGKRTLGLSYGLIAADLVMAPAIPSNTARGGGIIFPVLKSVAMAYDSDPEQGTERKMGTFLTFSSFQGLVVTSAMFLTSMAANPVAQSLAAEQGVEITWTNWATAAIVPGIVSLLVIPYLIYRIMAPEIKETPEAAEMAVQKLKDMGAMKRSEWIMLAVFVMLIVLWIFGSSWFKLHSTAVAFIGLGVLLLTGVLSWNDILNEKGAWNTLVWFSALVMMASYLSKLGLIPWFSVTMGETVGDMGWLMAFIVLILAYFYSHYLFASNTAHVTAMYGAFLAVCIAVGVPGLLAALVLGFASNLFSSMTHYGTGPAPVFFGSNYVGMGDWWKWGLVISILNLVIWLGVGGVWWKILGLW